MFIPVKLIHVNTILGSVFKHIVTFFLVMHSVVRMAIILITGIL